MNNFGLSFHSPAPQEEASETIPRIQESSVLKVPYFPIKERKKYGQKLIILGMGKEKRPTQ